MRTILINGEWVEAQHAAGHEVLNPATLQPLDVVADCGAADVDRAVRAALDALPPWRGRSGADRATPLRDLAAGLRTRAAVLAALLTRETGKPLCEAFDCIEGAAACFEHAAARAAAGAPLPGLAPARVAAVLVAANFPLLGMAAAIAPALADGLTVVCKPPRSNPLANLAAAQLFEALPPGVVNVLTGGADAGAALVEHPGVGLVAYAGDAALGRRIGARAAVLGKAVRLEHLPLSVGIVARDADLELAVAGVAAARLMNCGQRRAVSSRIYVDAALVGAFADRIHEYVALLEVGDPAKAATDLGPLVSSESAHRVEDQVGRLLRHGARLKLGGRRYQPWGLEGHFFQPTVLFDARGGATAAHEDLLGPVLIITPVAGIAAALLAARSAAQDAAPGLELAVYAGDAAAAARELRDGAAAPRVELVQARQSWWFPYADRRRPRT